MTQIDKAIEYLKNAAEQHEYIEPVDMLRDIFGIERKLVSEYHLVDNKKEIKVGDTVMVIGPSLGGGMDMVGDTFEVYQVNTEIDCERIFKAANGRWFSESSVELV